jgi:glutaredoxin
VWFHDVLADLESDPEPREIRDSRFSMEMLEDASLSLGWNSDTSVLDTEAHIVARPLTSTESVITVVYVIGGVHMFRSRSSSREPTRITLYSKPGCHLCIDARDLLERLRKRYAMSIDEIDISLDPGLFRMYDIRIPVIVFADGSELEAPIQEDQLRSALKAVARGR